jgi:RNA polymerase sigma-70 factor (ECF subfamily)
MSATTAPPAATEEFEAQRPHLLGIAYRMTGSFADAEDLVQEAWLRWQAANREDVAAPRLAPSWGPP